MQSIKSLRYLQSDEIVSHLANVEYIIMAQPAPEHFAATPLHFTIFLNTTDEFSLEVSNAILDKFLDENSIEKPIELMAQVMPVGFSVGVQDTPMPMLLVKEQDMRAIPNAFMYVHDFLADSSNFAEVKESGLSGWSYSYES